ncbi:heterokaryon incompatibility protein-domain-containing protein [Dendryphion nanum]|uniref:Heterokaryon incompatibility protein-domain-containing protein n=1 Tax=Dendryphion nanum TaxID=256645 RepID=A0A9P9DIR7_9PLEO|nr:heterokaryon incompatibility protein-domain-containing protein [Dendryphion nanum]
MSFFVYRKLDPDQIRLIHLFPKNSHGSVEKLSTERLSGASPSEPQTRVSCTVSHVSLELPPPYIALSYTWGDSNEKAPILIDGAIIHVTKNLEVALAHLTPEDQEISLWIDALCINQQDSTEKTEQVGQMHNIYSRATSVTTWLGPSADDSDAVMDWIQHYGSLSHKFGIGTKPELQLLRLLQALELHPETLPQEELKVFLEEIATHLSTANDDEDKITLALANFFKRGYWNRVWIVQELVHAKTVEFVCGTKTVAEEPLHHALRLLRNFGQFRQLKSAQQQKATDWDHRKPAVNTRNPINILKVRRTVGQFPLIYLIRTFRFFQATDPRDRIFALLSFASDAPAMGLRPDYRKPYMEVYAETTMLLLKNGFSDILSLCQAHDDASGLPSWVPDFTRISHRAPLQQRAMKRGMVPITTVLQPAFSASGSEKNVPVFSESVNGSFPSVSWEAKFIDTITNVGTPWKPQGLRKWLRDIRELSQSDSISSDPDRLKHVWRTAVADQEMRVANQKPRLSTHRLENAHHLLRDLDLEKEESDTILSRELRDYVYQLQDVAFGRRPFCTSKGYFGLGPSDMETGDLLYVCTGADVPHIFRSGHENRLQLVGEAYAHGLMDGVLMDTEQPRSIISIS